MKALLHRPRRRRQRYREPGEFFAALARLIRAAGNRAADSDPEDLKVLMGLRTSLDEAIVAAVAGVRASGATWEEIGALTGTTRQAAHLRWAARVDAHDDSPPGPE